ncbi:MAG: glycosyltransferase family 4 protein [Ktedonobacteraceae bacterium]
MMTRQKQGNPAHEHETQSDMSSVRIAYLLKGYPRLSETFILQEIVGLERHGFHLHLFSLLDPHEMLLHQAFQQVQAPLSYVHADNPDTMRKDFVRSLGYLLRRHPLRVLRVWLYVLTKRRHRSTFQRLCEATVLAKLLEQQNIRWLHAHFAHGPTTVADFVYLLTKIPFSFSAHAKDVYESSPDLLIRKIRRAQFVATCTGASKCYLTGLFDGLPDAEQQQQKIHLVYHGVNTQQFSPDETNLRGDEVNRVPLILSVGRLVEKKGYQYLIMACKILIERGIQFHCAIYGSGPLQQDLQQQIAQLDLEEYVHLYGDRTQETLPAIYRGATLFVLAPCIAQDGDRDGMPNVLLEAMATGLPVVSTPVGGIPELIEHERNGLLVPEKDALLLANALDHLLCDATLRNRLGKEARHFITAHFDAEQNLQRLLTCFQRHVL